MPQNQQEKLTQSFYEIPVNHNQNSMIIDRSYDWGYKQENQYMQGNQGYYPQKQYQIYSQQIKMGGPVHYQQFYKGRQPSPRGMQGNQLGLTDVTNNYLQGTQMYTQNTRQNNFRNQFIRLDSQQINRRNNTNLHTGYNKMNQHYSIEDLESHLGLIFKKILVFSSKIESLKNKIIKRNSEFSPLKLFQTFCDKKTKRLDLEGMKEFFQTFGFDFSLHFLVRLMVFLSGYRIKNLFSGNTKIMN